MAPVSAGWVLWALVIDFGIHIFVKRVRVSGSDEVSVVPGGSVKILRLCQKSRGFGLHSMGGVPILLMVRFLGKNTWVGVYRASSGASIPVVNLSLCTDFARRCCSTSLKSS